MIKYTAIFLFFLFFQCSVKGQGKAMPDTARLKEIVSSFIRLAYTKADKDSLIGYMAFPLYIHEGKAKKVFGSAAELRKELQKKYKKEKFTPVEYRIDSISAPAYCQLPDDKTKNCISLTAHVMLPYIGNNPQGTSLMTTFYLQRGRPWKVMSTANQY